MKIIHDNIWGDVYVSDLALSFIDTVEFQRLHYLKQTGTCYKVFLGATTTRFQHSIGTYYLVRKFIESIEKNSKKMDNQFKEISSRQKELCSLSGLLHDIGHGPFSHLWDIYMEINISKRDKAQIPKDHEERGAMIIRYMVKKYAIDLTDQETQYICSSITKSSLIENTENTQNTENWFDSIVNNKNTCFDMDKIDYLYRDCLCFGLTRNFDIFRIFQNVIVKQNKIYFCNRIKSEIDKIFLLREEFHKTIYRHPTVEKFQEYILEILMKRSPIIDSLEDFLELTDMSILNMMNKKERREFETRSWLDFKKPKQISNYKDNQRYLAQNNILYYERKNVFKK